MKNTLRFFVILAITIVIAGFSPKTADSQNVASLPTSVVMIEVAGGSFQMGCTGEQTKCSSDEKPVHQVALKSFSISKNEITNKQFADFLNVYGSDTVKNDEFQGQTMIYEHAVAGIIKNGKTWKAVAEKEDYPVINVTWYGANEYCNFYGGRLPTEAEWEFAARGGTKTQNYKFSGGNMPEPVAWYWNNSNNIKCNLSESRGTHPVGKKTPNELGICDMNGNVAEWCSDWYSSKYYRVSLTENPPGDDSGDMRVYRGGSWSMNSVNCRLSTRFSNYPNAKSEDIGFRMVK